MFELVASYPYSSTVVLGVLLLVLGETGRRLRRRWERRRKG
jgi:hypothetical protein